MQQTSNMFDQTLTNKWQLCDTANTDGKIQHQQHYIILRAESHDQASLWIDHFNDSQLAIITMPVQHGIGRQEFGGFPPNPTCHQLFLMISPPSIRAGWANQWNHQDPR